MNPNIKALILDVDGVLVGEKVGFNYPNPHPDVLDRLKIIRQRGVKISLCTAKPHYSVWKIIHDAELNNLHITEGGAVITDPINGHTIKKHSIDSNDAIKVVEVLLSQDVYTEIYTLNEYVIQKNQVSKLTEIHSDILQKEPKVVSSLAHELEISDIVKIMPIAQDDADKKRIAKLIEPFQNTITLSWGVHPVALPHQFGIITAKGISKKIAALEIAESEHVRFDEILAVGDSTSDWQFIESCGYVAAMGNASDELKSLVSAKEYCYIGDSVDNNGILNIFDHFKI